MLKEMLTSKTTDYRIMVVPGNHDIRLKPQPFFEKCMCRRERSYNFDGFRDFAAELTGSEDYNNYTKQSIISVEFADITWLLCNTAYHGNRRYGRIDAERIKKELADAKKPTVLLMHHTLFSSDENDSSTLRNGYEIVNSIKSNTIAILHGHTHGYKKVSLGDNSYERQSESGNGVFSGLFDSDAFLQAVKESIQDAVRNNEENVIAEMKQLIEEITVSSSVENTKKNNPSKERNDRDSFQLASSFLSEWNAE